LYELVANILIVVVPKIDLKGMVCPGNTKGGSITAPLTSCLTGLEPAVWQLTIFVLFAKQTNPNQSNRRSTLQWYFPL